ncbi:MAG: hypothetical protein NT105_23870 [Verrucomicrobia bacterium]|nr:hypothetical protein [Verrucomicrobiota bacterium]
MKPIRYKLGKVAIPQSALLRIGAAIVWRNAAIVGFLFSLLVIALLLTGCANSALRTPHSAIPPMPPKPTTAATAGAIESATANASEAQTSVRAGRDLAKQDEGLKAVPHLDKADAQLDTTRADLAAAKAHATELEGKIAADRAAHDMQATAYQSQIGNLKSEMAAGAAANKKLAKENTDLKNEVLRKAQLVIGGAGSFLLLVAAGCFAAWIWLGFGAGWKVALVSATVGAAALALAMMLKAIVVSTIVALAACAVAALGYAAWHLWRDSRDTLASVVEGVETAKAGLDPEAVSKLHTMLRFKTSDADKKLIELLKSKLKLS